MRAYQETAIRVAYLQSGSAADAEDIVQEAFVKAFTHLDRFRDGAPFRPWFLHIVANEAKNRRRATASRPTVEFDEQALALMDTTAGPEDSAITSERARELAGCLNSLSERDRTMLVYKYLLDLDEAELAAALQIPRGTVKSRVFRALAKARTVLAANRVGHE